jgi:tRNA nucleotidyltransferase (CCA-adding enzyme)
VHAVSEMRPGTLVQFLQDTDAIRQPNRFREFLLACESDSRGRTGYEDKPFPQAERLLQLLEAVMQVDAGAIARQFDDPEKIRAAVFEARVDAVKVLH